MSDRKKRRGRPRVVPVLSYGTELAMRNNIDRRIIKPKYLQEDESRESTPARSEGSSKSRNLNESEYHYGSDFDEYSDQDVESISTKMSYSEASDNDSELDMDMDNGDGSELPLWRIGISSRTQTPIPIWLQDRMFDPLILPKSSDDLLLPNFILLKAISIYEVLRHFEKLVRLSPFRFEDFCACLLSEDQNVMLVEIHIALLKSLIREEEAQQTHFGPLDLKDSINITLFVLDHMTWPEILRLYLQSDKEFRPLLKILNSCQYPVTNLNNRLTILQFLCDQFLQTSGVRENLLSEGRIKYDEYCRVCHKPGHLLCCDSCSAVYHLDCIDPPITQNPLELEDWTCSICKSHQLEGVTDCLSPMEVSGLLCRQEQLGFDRHGRKYWFLIRRLFVEEEDGEVWYYSSCEQFDLLQSIIDQDDLEEGLHIAFREFGEDIRRHMKITERLTRQKQGPRTAAFFTDQDYAINNKDKLTINLGNGKSKIKTDEPLDPEVELKVESDSTGEMKIKQDEIKEESEESKSSFPIIGGGIKEEKKEDITEEMKEKLLQDKRNQLFLYGDQIYRLGCDGEFKSYTNIYVSNPLALNKQQHNEERDKKRHISHKFSVTSPFDFKWTGQTTGSFENMITTVRQSLLSMEQNISSYFYHPHWQHIRKSWQQSAVSSASYQDFAKLMRWLSACIKPAVFNSVWQDSLGHTQLRRITALEREEKKRQEKKDKKDNDEESRYYQLVKFTKGVKHTLWKMKGEEYRLHGLWGWRWLAVNRPAPHVSMNTVGLRAGPDKILIPVKTGTEATIRSIPINPIAYKQLSQNWKNSQNHEPGKETSNEVIVTISGHQQKVEVVSVNLNDCMTNGVIDVSKDLSSKNRLVYTYLAKETSVLDSLLSRRIAIQAEEKDCNEKKEEDKNENTKVEELPDSEPLSVHKDRPAGHLLKEMRTYKIKYEALDKLEEKDSCYTRDCRKENGNCYSPSCQIREKIKQKLINSVNIYKIVTSKPAPFSQVGVNYPIKFEEKPADEQSGNDESSQQSIATDKSDRSCISNDTRGKVFLKNIGRNKKAASTTRLPQLSYFKRKNGKASVMILSSWEAKLLARKAGQRNNVNGFNHNAKMNQQMWPYPCSRPALKTMWLYRTSTVNSVYAAALALKVFWSCLKWEDMGEKCIADGRKQITTETEIIQTELLKRRYFGRFLECTQYLQRKVVIPLDVPRPVREFTPSQRSGLRKRRRVQSPVNKQPESTENWVDEEKINLWEIKNFGERLEKAQLKKETATPTVEFKAKIEEQMKLQRANYKATKTLEPPPNIVKVALNSTTKTPNVVTLANTLPLAGRKIVATKSGRIISLQASPEKKLNVSKVTVANASVFPVSSQKGLRLALPGVRQRAILPRGVSSPSFTPSTPGAVTSATAVTTTGITNIATNTPQIRPPGQQIHIFRLPNGQLQVRGLQEGQQVLQRPDGKLQLINSKTSPITAPPKITQIQSPPKETPKVNTQISPGQIMKINNGQQIILRTNPSAKQIVSINKNNANAVAQSMPLKTTDGFVLKTINKIDSIGQTQLKTGPTIVQNQGQPGQNQFIIQNQSSGQAQPKVVQNVSPIGQTQASPTVQNSSQTTLRVQVRMTDQGPKTIIQGLQTGVGLTRDHIVAIQQQVRNMVSQYNLQVNQLSPVMTLTLNVASKQPNQETKCVLKPQTPSNIIESDKSKLNNQQISVSEAAKSLAETNKLKDAKNDPAQNKSPEKFVLTNEYIQQSIKTALSKSDLTPDVEEKLMQLQKHTMEKSGVLKSEDTAFIKSLKKAREDDDDEWMNEEAGLKSKPKKPRTERMTRNKKETNIVASSKSVVQDARKKMARQQKLDGMLGRHKELLKKDILKKRALLEKELQFDIHKELAIARQQIQQIEKNKIMEMPLGRKRTTSAISNPPPPPPPPMDMPKPTKREVSPQKNKNNANNTTKSRRTTKGKSKKIVCICRTPFDDTKFYVGCDLCGNWFHGDCVGITEALSRNMTEYVCDDCANAKLNKELFCLCRQPYDETQFYICCEKCEDWYHGKCIGIMQAEAEDIDDYICPKCDPRNEWNEPCQRKLTQKEYIELKKLSKALVQHKNAWPFLEPVDQSEVPDYYKVVKIPMDLRNIDNRVSKHQYTNLAQFVGDVMLVFDNCRAYNPPNSSFCACAITLENFFGVRLRQYKQKITNKS